MEMVAALTWNPMSQRAYDSSCETLVNEPRRWLVTGVAGFIGSALMERLLDLGQSVVGVDSFITGYQHNLDDVLSINPDQKYQFKFIEGDLCDPAVAKKAVRDVDIVLHQAALGSVPRSIEEPLPSNANNVTAFLNVLEAARHAGIKRVVYASSSSVYGDHPELPKREEVIGTCLSPYAASKRCDEVYADVFASCYDMNLVGLRYFNVFGRRQDPNGAYAAVIPRWIDTLLHGKACQIYGDGTASRDFCYIDNVVQANILAGVHKYDQPMHRVYNVGCNERTTVRELFDQIREGLARFKPDVGEAEPEHLPARAGDILHSLAAIDRISDELGYRSTHSVAAGMHETVAWFVENQAKTRSATA